METSGRQEKGENVRVSLDLLGQLEQHVNLPLAPAPLDEPAHHICHPRCPLAAGRALATRLVLIKLCEPGDAGDDVGLLVEDNDRACAESRAEVLQRVVIHPVTGVEQKKGQQAMTSE